MGPDHESTAAVVVRGVVRHFGATVALAGVDAEIRSGIVTAVVGANGSGKSTLLRMVAGLLPATSGEILGPAAAPVRDLRSAAAAGIVLVPQEPALADHLTVWQNVALGRPEARRGPWLRDRAGRDLAARYAEGLLPLDLLDRKAGSLSKARRQLVQLVAALARNPAVLLLDEPTAVLDEEGVAALHRLVQSQVAHETSVVLVSHRLRDVLGLAQEVIVLRNGLVRHTGPVSAATERNVVHLLGADEPADRPEHRPIPGHVVLEAEDLHGLRGLQVDRLSVHAGEIVGLAGQSGSGRSRLASVLAGADHARGWVRVDGHPVRLGSIRSAQRCGIRYVPEDRQRTAILANQPVWANLLLGRRRASGRRVLRDRRGERLASSELIERFEVRPRDPDQLAGLLSGGNQQKLVIGRALASPCRVLVADEPTQGVDASARGAIHAALARAAAEGAAVVVVCSDFEELFEISDRIVVLRDGRVALDRPVHDVDQDHVLAASLGAELEEARA